MSVSVTLVSIVKAASGRVYINWSDGSQTEYGSLDTILTGLSEVGSDPNLAKAFLLAWWVARSPDGSNTNMVEGKTLTLDLYAADPLKVQ